MANEIGVQIVERGAHLGGVVLVHTKDDGLGEAIGLFQEIGEMPRDGLGAGTQRHAALEIGGGVNLVGYLPPVTVEVVLAGPPASGVPLRDDAMHAIWRKEAVIDPLPEAVLINWITKIEVAVAILIPQWRCGHSKLICGREVFEDFAPVGFFARCRDDTRQRG